MEIADIKLHLSLSEVLMHYGLEAKNGANPYMMRCPFHEDRTPSFQIYPRTQTFCCFSSNCHAGTGDAIEFIRLMEGSNKHEAILKAKSMIMTVPPKQEITKASIFLRFWQSCLEGIKRSPKAKEYLEKRSISDVGAGYCSEKSMLNWSKPLRESAQKHGLLKQGKPLLRNCLVFALLDKNGSPAGFYGRNILDGKVKHVYVANRKGLFPSYPAPDTKRIILAESVLDSLSIETAENESVLALYGTNGLTGEHLEMLESLEKLEEIVLFLDGDEAGRKANVKLAEKLKLLNSSWNVSIAELPDGEDANSLLSSHEAGIHQHLIENATSFFLSSEETEEVEEQPKTDEKSIIKLIEESPEKLSLRTETATYWVLGGVKADIGALKITLHIESPQGKKYRCKLDLYETRQAEKVAKEAGLKIGLNPEKTENDLSKLADLLDEYRSPKNQEKKPETVSKSERNSLLAFLKDPNLMEKLNGLIGKSGVVGEESTRLLLLLAASTHITESPLHILIQGSSGSGKTHLMGAVCSLLPQEHVHRLTRVTDGSLYNYGENELSHKLLALEDMDGLGEYAIYALRELQSSHRLSSSTSGKDALGNSKGRMTIVKGPIASLACTTKGHIYEDNASRCLTVAVDEGKEQTKRIIAHQNAKEAGLWNTAESEKAKLFVRRLARLVEPLEVLNPYAQKVRLPEGIRKERRLNGIYHILVRQVALWHQYQRKKDADGKILAMPQDLRMASELMFESMVLKVDELDGQLRGFFESLKEYLKDEDKEFCQREVRQALGISKTQLHRHIQSLLELEYIRIVGGHMNRGYSYQVSYWDDNAGLRNRIKKHLESQIEALERVK